MFSICTRDDTYPAVQSALLGSLIYTKEVTVVGVHTTGTAFTLIGVVQERRDDCELGGESGCTESPVRLVRHATGSCSTHRDHRYG